jgi:hypothetical protein
MVDDRSLQNTAKGAAGTAGQLGGTLATTGEAIGANIIPGLERDTTTPPGLSPADLAHMEQTSLETAGGAAGSARGVLATRAARLRNPAGVTAGEAAATEGASRSAGKAVQDILSENALIKEKQRAQAYSELGGLYGANISGATKAMGVEAEDINSAANAEKEGWYQNLLAGLQTTGQLGLGSAKAAGFG